jgi:hypothetical protein
MISYTISPNCTGPGGAQLFLTAEKQAGGVVVWTRMTDPNNPSLPDPSQLWVPVMSTGGGVFLLNVYWNQILASSGNEATVFLIGLNQINANPNNSWNYVADGGAWQLFQNDDLNLNVLGDGPYGNGSPVGSWGWGGGDANETWSVSIVTS